MDIKTILNFLTKKSNKIKTYLTVPHQKMRIPDSLGISTTEINFYLVDLVIHFQNWYFSCNKLDVTVKKMSTFSL